MLMERKSTWSVSYFHLFYLLICISDEMLQMLCSPPLSHRHGQQAGSCCCQCSVTATICHTLHCCRDNTEHYTCTSERLSTGHLPLSQRVFQIKMQHIFARAKSQVNDSEKGAQRTISVSSRWQSWTNTGPHPMWKIRIWSGRTRMRLLVSVIHQELFNAVIMQ